MLVVLSMAAISVLIAFLGLRSGELFSLRGESNYTRDGTPVKFWATFAFWIAFAIFCIAVAFQNRGVEVDTQRQALGPGSAYLQVV